MNENGVDSIHHTTLQICCTYVHHSVPQTFHTVPPQAVEGVATALSVYAHQSKVCRTAEGPEKCLHERLCRPFYQ